MIAIKVVDIERRGQKLKGISLTEEGKDLLAYRSPYDYNNLVSRAYVFKSDILCEWQGKIFYLKEVCRDTEIHKAWRQHFLHPSIEKFLLECGQILSVLECPLESLAREKEIADVSRPH